MAKRILLIMLLASLTLSLFALGEGVENFVGTMENTDTSLVVSDDLKGLSRLSNEASAVMLSLAASYCTVPKIKLNGVNFGSSDGFFPSSVTFSASDVYQYEANLDNPEGNAFARFLTSSVSSVLPLKKMALDSLRALNLKSGDVLLSGSIEFKGLDGINITDMMDKEILKRLNVEVVLDLLIYGSRVGRNFYLKGSVYLSGSEDGKMTLDPSNLSINGNTPIEGTLSLDITSITGGLS